MSSNGAQLSSVLTSLEELTKQVTATADDMSGTPQDHVAYDLYDVERSLRSATRRLRKVLKALPEA